MMIFSLKNIDGIDLITGENEFLRYEIAPAAGGKLLSVFNKMLGHEFLWRNKNISLELSKPGADYDVVFFGGIDELIPNDIPESINSISYPDHGELWTTPLEYRLDEEQISVFGKMRKSGLYYRKSVRLGKSAPEIFFDYRIRNESGSTRNFLWKLHVALQIEAGDRLMTSARKGKVVDPAYSRFASQHEFKWPVIDGVDASVVPEKNNTVDFYYLYEMDQAEMNFVSEKKQCIFSIQYDKKLFPYQWYFASYGGFLDHYTAILEPCSSMPLSVNESAGLGQCSVLEPGQEINTTIRIFAGQYP